MNSQSETRKAILQRHKQTGKGHASRISATGKVYYNCFQLSNDDGRILFMGKSSRIIYAYYNCTIKYDTISKEIEYKYLL